MRMFVFGLGYSAAAAVKRMRPRLDWVGATARSPAKAEALRAAGIEPFLFDGEQPVAGLRDLLRSCHAVLSTVGTDEAGGDPVLARHGADLAMLTRSTSVAYLSTVGVYGDHGGRWVDERTACKPVSRRSLARVEAETRWRRLAEERGIPVAVLRLSGIYGPGRNQLLNLADGTARRLVKPGQVFNRIHVDDIAQAIDRALVRRADGLFNITDDEPAAPQDVVAYAARVMGVEPPPEQDFETASLSPMARSFYGENKRVSNGKSKRDLGMDYAYPDYRSAIDAMWADGSWRG